MLSANQAESYDKDLKYIVHISRVILRLIGAWPLARHSSNLEKISQRIINLACYFFFLFTIIPILLRMLLKESDPHVRFKLVGPIVNCASAAIKYTFLLLRSADIRMGLEETKRDWMRLTDRHDRETMLSRGKVGRRLVILCIIFMYGGGLSYRVAVPLSRGPIVTAENITIRPLACPSYFPKIDEQSSPTYEIVFFLQCLAGLLTYCVTAGVCGLSALFVLHVCGQLRILMKKMTSIADGENLQDEIVDKRIAAVVEHQTRTKRFLKHVERIVEHMCLVEIIGCTFLICFTGYYCIVEWQDSDTTATVTYFVLMVSFVFSVFIFCYIGQQLDDESNDLGLTMATIDWYRLPAKRARSLTLVIAMSNCSMKITAGKMIYMSLTSFTNIMKTAMGYFNILRSFTT